MTTSTTVRILLALALAALLTGCSSGTSAVIGDGGIDAGTDGGGDAAFAKAIEDAAVEVDSMTQDAMAGETTSIEGDPSLVALGRPSPTTVDRSVERTMACPAGGELTVGGTLEGTFDRDTRTLEIVGGGSRAAEGCTFERGDMSLTIDGSSSWEWMRRFVNGLPDGPQTRRYSGSWTAVNDEGMTRSCSFDYTVSYDPETRETTVEGTLCDSPLDPRESWKAAS